MNKKEVGEMGLVKKMSSREGGCTCSIVIERKEGWGKSSPPFKSNKLDWG